MRLIDADEFVEKLIGKVTDLRKLNTKTIGEVLGECKTIEFDSYGGWIMRGGRLYCSACKKLALYDKDRDDWWYHAKSNFCPHCGANMYMDVAKMYPKFEVRER